MSDAAFVRFFREAAPYIRAHRDSTFVIVFGGELLRSAKLPSFVHDVALLHALGVKVVLVAGSRPQIEKRLTERGRTSRYANGVRITDAAALAAAKESAGANRVELERLLSMGMPNSPMAGARVPVATGNFVTARPYGIVDGVDHGFTGRVRKVDAPAIQRLLDSGAIVTLTPLGYSASGEAFNVSTPQLAAEAAVALGAQKLICLAEGKGVLDGKGGVFGVLSADECAEMIASKRRLAPDVRRHLNACHRAISGGVRRAHLVSRRVDDALIKELFTKDGVGTLITDDDYQGVRRATKRDVPRLKAILQPLEAQGLLVERSEAQLLEAIDDFLVVEREGLVVACCALHPYPESGMGELACLAVAQDSRAAGRGEVLVRAIEREAQRMGLHQLFLLTTQGTHFFAERGFATASPKVLPPSRKAYDKQRRSKVLVKELAARG